MFERYKSLVAQTAQAEKEVAAHRETVVRAVAETILTAEQLSDAIKPERATLIRHHGVNTRLPLDLAEPVIEVLEIVSDLGK